MPAETDEPTTKEELSTRQSGISKWMAGLHEALPNPSVGAPNDTTTDQPAAADSQTLQTEKAGKISEGTDGKPATDGNISEGGSVGAGGGTSERQSERKTDTLSDEARWPRSAKEWKNFTSKQKERNEAYEKQITEKDAKIKELEAKTTQTITPEIQKEIDGIKKENDELSQQLRLVSITNHPRFKQYFQSKTNATLSQVKSCVPADQIETVTKLLQAPDSESRDSAINELLEEMTPLKRARMQGVITGLSAIQAEMEAEISRAGQDYEQMMGQAKAQKEQQQANFTKLLDDTVKVMQDAKSGRPEYQMREGETEWNASVQKRIESGRKLITGNLPAEVMFKAAFDAAAYPDVLAGYKAALGEVDKLKKQIAAMSAANPKVETQKRSETNGTGSTPAMPKDARPMDYTKRWVEKFGQAMRGETP